MTFTNSDRDEIRERFLRIDAAVAADVLDDLRLPNQGLAPGIGRVVGNKVAGWVYTIAGQMSPYEGTGDPLKMEACEGLEPSDVAVWAGGGRGICYFGELIAIGMQERGAVGSVLDGGIRDTRLLSDVNFPVFARYTTAVQSIGRWKVTGYQAPIYLPGATSSYVTANPGDFILGDEDGVVVIPTAVVKEVLEKTEKMTDQEVELRAALASGMTLKDALKKFGHV